MTALLASGVGLWRWYRLGDDTGRSPAEVDRLRTRAAASAALMLVAGISGGASAVLRYGEAQRDRRECRDVLSSLASTLQDELADRPEPEITFENPLGLEDQDLDAAVEDVALDFDGVTLERGDGLVDASSYHVEKDGTYLGTIDEDGVAADRCGELSP